MSHHLVEARDLAYVFPDGTVGLDGLSFRIVHGESVAVVGANGAGKSTLLLQLGGVLTPTRGQVRVGDLPVTRRTLPEIRRTVGLIFQDPDDQLFTGSVAEDVAFGPRNLGLPEEEVEARVVAALERVGALHLRDRAPHRLSGGEKRAVAIATVLALSPSILVLDEPSANLDCHGRRLLIELLRGFDHTKIIATHDLELVLELCPRTIILQHGRLQADGPTPELFGDLALLQACHLEPPARLRRCPHCGGAQTAPALRPQP